MKKINKIWLALVVFAQKAYVKYTVIIVLGLAFVGVLGESSLLAHIRNLQRIDELQAEIDDYTEQHQHNRAQIRELDANPRAMERIARERYFMKADDEDIFVLSDDE
jgi:cell division protein FtsB